MTDMPPPPGSGEHPAGETTPPPPPAGGAPAPIDYGTTTGYPGPYAGPPPDKDSKTMALLCHLLPIFTGFLGPLIIWLIKKDTSPFVDDQGKESLNFQLTLLIVYLIGGITACLIIGWFIVVAAWITSLVLCIMASMKANEGVAYRYPFAIRLIK
jgi:uncharacterized Tic20 family protein